MYQHAKETPAQYCNQIPDLVKYLSKAAKTESEKVEIFTYWIALNISYDVYEYSIRDNWSKDVVHNLQIAHTVFKTKLAVCEGYSNLLKEMCDVAKIKCYKIVGYSKGIGYHEGIIPNQADHAWNAVFVENKWCLVDATWTEGNATYENNKMVAKKEFNMKQIFMDPQKFILRHLPSEPQWQLLENPIPMSAFFANTDYKGMEKFKMPFYSFNDSINFYENLPKDEKEIRKAENEYQFTNNKWKFAFECFNYAQDQHLYEGQPLEQLTRTLEYYTKAKTLFETFSGSSADENVKLCTDWINYINNRIANQQDLK